MPAPAVITCPACQKRFKGKPELGGKKIKCPQCDKPFVVPNEEPPAKAAKPAAIKFAVEPPKDDESYGVTDVDIAPRCPHCAHEMESREAVICLNCGFNTLTRQIGKTVKIQGLSRQEHLKYLLPSIGLVAALVAIVVVLIYFNTVVTPRLAATKARYIVDESLRMWMTIVALAVIWGLGLFAFNRLALHPMPSEEEILTRKPFNPETDLSALEIIGCVWFPIPCLIIAGVYAGQKKPKAGAVAGLALVSAIAQALIGFTINAMSD